MAFIMEFVEHFIRAGMEDPRDRDERSAARIRKTKAKCEELKSMWAQPVKAYGYWGSDRFNHKYLMDLRHSNLSGRQNPYDTVTRVAANAATEAVRE
ncbi:hypothetical protein CLOM_g21760 [Closterium sp. NIES-68]|nr:hypothetical protein CLOM_g21760 [Closterium sp. NIES-68]GJP79846.1 hypothetical protein CLOP_g10051 [Closterium sp. NIES-67]